MDVLGWQGEEGASGDSGRPGNSSTTSSSRRALSHTSLSHILLLAFSLACFSLAHACTAAVLLFGHHLPSPLDSTYPLSHPSLSFRLGYHSRSLALAVSISLSNKLSFGCMVTVCGVAGPPGAPGVGGANGGIRVYTRVCKARAQILGSQRIQILASQPPYPPMTHL
jgi:hypothetical protein